MSTTATVVGVVYNSLALIALVICFITPPRKEPH